MFCGKCGAEIINAKAFCGKCGAPIAPKSNSNQSAPVSPVIQSQTTPLLHTTPVKPVISSSPAPSPALSPTPSPVSSPAPSRATSNEYVSSTSGVGFVSPDEHIVYTLRNNASQNIFSGEGVHTEDVVLTNKRIYYNDSEGIINVSKSERIVNVADVTCAGFVDYKPQGLLVVGLIFAFLMTITFMPLNVVVGLIIGGIFFVFTWILYVALKKTTFEIHFPGGGDAKSMGVMLNGTLTGSDSSKISFSVKGYSIEQIREFHRLIFSIKEGMRG